MQQPFRYASAGLAEAGRTFLAPGTAGPPFSWRYCVPYHVSRLGYNMDRSCRRWCRDAVERAGGHRLSRTTT